MRERVLQTGVFLLPLVCWAGLEHPFSTPKLWLLGALNITLLAAVLLAPKNARRGLRTPDWPWLIWLAAVALSALTSRYVSIEALLLCLLPLPLCWALREGRIAPEPLLRAILWASIAESALVVLQYANLDPLRWLGWQPELFSSSRMRVYGTLGNPNFVAAWLCATLPLYAGVVRKGARAGWGAALALQLAAIVATGSRVFVLALPVAALVLAAGRLRLGRWWLAILPLIAAAVWLSPARPLSVSAAGRWYLTRVAVSHWREVPPLGYGAGSFGVQFAQWQAAWVRDQGSSEETRRFAGELEHAHNDYVEFCAEYGPVGFCVFLGLWGWLLWGARRTIPANAGAWAALACLATIALVDFPLHRPAEWGLYWLMLGVASSGRDGASEKITN